MAAVRGPAPRIALGSVAPTVDPARRASREALAAGADVDEAARDAATTEIHADRRPALDRGLPAGRRGESAAAVLGGDGMMACIRAERGTAGMARHGDPRSARDDVREPTLVIRGHVATPDGVRAAAIHIADGRIVAGDRVRRRVRRRTSGRGGRRARLPGPGGHPRPRERAGARPSGRDSPPRPARPRRAASPPSSTCRSTASPPRPASRRSRPSVAAAAGHCAVDVGFLGGFIARQRRRAGAAPSRGRVRVQVLPVSLRAWTSFPPCRPRDLRRAGADPRRARRAADGARRAPRGAGARGCDRGEPRGLRHLAGHAARSRRRPRRSSS